MSNCTIQLDQFQGHYFSGSVITGRVVCTFRKTKNIRGIKLTLKGKEHTNWTEWESHRDPHKKETRKRAVQYTGENTFYRMETTLVGAGVIGPGMISYPFTFTLPKNLPGTYYGKYGWVKYHLKVTIDRAYKFDIEDVRELVVIALIDFNEIVGLLQLQPVAYAMDKTLCCWCCASGPIMMSVRLDKEAFVLGETAKVEVEVKNQSNKNIESVSVELGMKIDSRVTTPRQKTQQEYQPIAIIKDNGVGAHGEKNFSFMLQIPAVSAIPNFNLCTLFQQWSKLKVTATLPVPHKNLKVSTRVIVGHIPVGHNVQVQLSSYMPSQVNMGYQPDDPLYCYIEPCNSSLPSTMENSSSFDMSASNVSSLGPSASAIEGGPIQTEGQPQVHMYCNVAPYPSTVSTISSTTVFTPTKFEPPSPTETLESPAAAKEREAAKVHESPPPSYDEAIISPKVESSSDEL